MRVEGTCFIVGVKGVHERLGIWVWDGKMVCGMWIWDCGRGRCVNEWNIAVIGACGGAMLGCCGGRWWWAVGDCWCETFV